MRGNTALAEQMKMHYHLLVIHIFLKDWLKLNYPDLINKEYAVNINGIRWNDGEYWFNLVAASVELYRKDEDTIMLTGFVSFLLNYNSDTMRIKNED